MDNFYTTISLVIKYKKGIQNKVVDMLSRPPTNASFVIHQNPLVHASYVEQYKKDEDFKEKISKAPILALLYLQQPFEIESDASGYAMGAALMQHKQPIRYHYETFSKTIINYPTYDKELYALVQSVKSGKIT